MSNIINFSDFMKRKSQKAGMTVSGVEKGFDKMGIQTRTVVHSKEGIYMTHHGSMVNSPKLHNTIKDHGFELVHDETVNGHRQVHYSHPKSEETLRVDHIKGTSNVKIHHYTY